VLSDEVVKFLIFPAEQKSDLFARAPAASILRSYRGRTGIIFAYVVNRKAFFGDTPPIIFLASCIHIRGGGPKSLVKIHTPLRIFGM